MKGNSVIKRSIAILLLLIFLLQMGAGLCIHNLLHTKSLAEQVHSKHNDAKGITFACNCVDNFLTPFIETDQPVVLPQQTTYTVFTGYFTEKIYFTSLIFSSLRGPPVL